MTKQYDVISICNALVDILMEVTDEDLAKLDIRKGVMHLVDEDQQTALLGHFKDHHLNIELGGSAMNATRSLASMGAKTAFVGMIGQDDFGRKITTRLKELGIVNRLTDTTQSTGSSAILITPDGERTMNTCLGASSLYGESIVPHEDIKAAKILHFAGYQWSTDNQRKAIEAAIKTAKENATIISFDVADPFICETFREPLIEVIEKDADIVFANRDEVRSLYEMDEESAARKIASFGCVAAIKLGADGAMIAKEGEVFKVAPVPTNVMDTTAAGDMFAAGFLYGYAKDASLEVCGQMGATLASDVISRLGAVVSDDALYRVKGMQ